MTDRRTINRILKRAKIADIISPYLKLIPRGTDFVSYCPFHNGKMKTLMVNSSTQTYHCTECDKNGSIIDFVIDMMHLNYQEAVQYIANIYGIGSTEPSEKSDAQTLIDINEIACSYYQEQLTQTETGRNVALSYFKQQRGFSDEIINEFRLGFSPARADNTLISQLQQSQYSEPAIIDSGIGVKVENNPIYDRFHNRVTFPIMNLAGKIVAFSCRTMKRDENIAKYKNTNDTPIYTKGNEVYGLYQARKHILEEDRCILVEGNADVVSMHMAGFRCTVAPLGTGFTYSQACVLRRFTSNIVLLFDGDTAGLHANEVALQHLLPLDVAPSIVLLPQGDDPDSFARRLGHDGAQQYINDNAINLVQFYFKTKLNEQLNNPIRTSQVAREIIQKIALIPNPITRAAYAKQCSQLLQINEESILTDIKQEIFLLHEAEFRRNKQAQARVQFQASAQSQPSPTQTGLPGQPEPDSQPEENTDSLSTSLLAASATSAATSTVTPNILNKEREIMHYVAKYGMVQFGLCQTADNEAEFITLIEYIKREFDANNLTIHNNVYQQIFNLGLNLLQEFQHDYKDFLQSVEEMKKISFKEGIEEIKTMDLNMASIQKAEDKLQQRINQKAIFDCEEFSKKYFEEYLCTHPNNIIRNESLQLCNEPFKLSKIHTQHATVRTEYDMLDELVQDAINNLRYELINQQIGTLQKQLTTETNSDLVNELMMQLNQLFLYRKKLAENLGDRVINPSIK